MMRVKHSGGVEYTTPFANTSAIAATWDFTSGTYRLHRKPVVKVVYLRSISKFISMKVIVNRGAQM